MNQSLPDLFSQIRHTPLQICKVPIGIIRIGLNEFDVDTSIIFVFNSREDIFGVVWLSHTEEMFFTFKMLNI